MTVDAVIDALGGTSAVAQLTLVRSSAVSNWRRRGRIPSEKFMTLADALKRADLAANPVLFGFELAEARP